MSSGIPFQLNQTILSEAPALKSRKEKKKWRFRQIFIESEAELSLKQRRKDDGNP
jgi:hypothetical protein